jgi:hypothetical protein
LKGHSLSAEPAKAAQKLATLIDVHALAPDSYAGMASALFRNGI